ncbi:restriction endonuclease subunit S [Pasteurella multocida subsp. multocida]|nr:restriction endonuclease subunit S [Pasteurella multocida]QDA14700.1 restriction endonuclease subunit S [Pasteurella multocida subsp. multocida]
MNNKKSSVPKLRFPEFTDAWEQRKLGELATFSKGIGFSKSDLKSSGEPIILYGQLYTQYQTVINDVDTFVTSNKNSIFSEGDEVIVPASGETAEDIARASAVGKAGIILGGDLNIIKPYSDINSIFLALNISNGKTQKELSKKAQGKSVVHLRNDDLKTIALIYPIIQEQQKIGSFFTALDRLITTHQRKLENVKKLKKSLLQKMFPKNGQEFPEIRFPEFTDAWEQRKLGELATFSKGIGFSKSDLKSSGEPIILYGQLYTQYQTVINDVDTFVTSNKNSIFSEGDEVIVPASGETAEDIARASAVGKAGIILGGDLNIIKPYSDINSIFLALNISNGKTQKELSKKAQGKSVVHLRNDDLKTIALIYPIIQEQQKIGSFFTALDRLITTHQRKLENVKKLKKALLQQMFV